ncbi:biopolymer transporter ExbD [Ferrimonas pelagia]|uniref:Biopolymer transporter ExbD n=1 Tax=Ferrimonas pelagia TaxID=1177826 RepID=A0ABP9EGA2_9GAMM
MLSERPDVDQDAEINMTPMLDVVFILLIFFIVSTSFTTQTAIEIERPHASTAESMEQTPVLLVLDAAGRVYLDDQTLDVYYLEGRLRQLVAQTPQIQLLIMADENCPTGATIEVLDIARRSGIQHSPIAASVGIKP